MSALLRADFTIRMNADWRDVADLAAYSDLPETLTGLSATMTLEKHGAPDSRYTVSSGSGTLVLGPGRIIKMAVPAASVAIWGAGRFHHDLILLDGSRRIGVWDGIVTIIAGVTA